MSLVRGAKIVDVTLVAFCNVEGRNIFDGGPPIDLLAEVLIDAFLSALFIVVVFGVKIVGWEKIAAVTERGRLTISQLLTLIVFIGLIATTDCSLL
jgi:hypothetical protein